MHLHLLRKLPCSWSCLTTKQVSSTARHKQMVGQGEKAPGRGGGGGGGDERCHVLRV